MAKVRTTICDICGKSVYQHTKHQYQIQKRFWEIGRMWKRIDLCEDCWGDMQNTILSRQRNNQ